MFYKKAVKLVNIIEKTKEGYKLTYQAVYDPFTLPDKDLPIEEAEKLFDMGLDDARIITLSKKEYKTIDSVIKGLFPNAHKIEIKGYIPKADFKKLTAGIKNKGFKFSASEQAWIKPREKVKIPQKIMNRFKLAGKRKIHRKLKVKKGVVKMARKKRTRKRKASSRKTKRTRKLRVSRKTIMREAWAYMHRHGVSLKEALKYVWSKYKK